MKRIYLSLFLVLIALFTVTASAQKAEAESPVVAKWNVVFSAPGQDVAGTLNLEKETNGHRGVISTELGDSPLSDIKITGDSFNGKVVVNAQGQSFAGTITGSVKDGKISGELVLEGLGNIPFSGSKVEPK